MRPTFRPGARRWARHRPALQPRRTHAQAPAHLFGALAPPLTLWQRFATKYRANGLHTIWGHPPDSGVRPCAVYLRHCVLAAERMGEACLASFLDETYLIDRVTTIRQYLEQHPEVMSTLPPPALAERYGG